MEGVLSGCADITASLHDVAPTAGPPRTLRGELDAAQAEIAAIAALAPALAGSLSLSLESLEAAAQDAPLPPVFSQGDLTPGQFLFDGPLRGLVDFDTTSVAEPALDLGQFTGHLAVTAGKQLSAAGRADAAEVRELTVAFLGQYVYAAGLNDASSLLARTAAYRQLSLSRIAVRSWRQLKPARVLTAQRLLEQERREPGPAEGAAWAVRR
jgi:aminoglycoside phosphotransferase (APT) family kinase protein